MPVVNPQSVAEAALWASSLQNGAHQARSKKEELRRNWPRLRAEGRIGTSPGPGCTAAVSPQHGLSPAWCSVRVVRRRWGCWPGAPGCRWALAVSRRSGTGRASAPLSRRAAGGEASSGLRPCRSLRPGQVNLRRLVDRPTAMASHGGSCLPVSCPAQGSGKVHAETRSHG
jgi:hypothetical protein